MTGFITYQDKIWQIIAPLLGVVFLSASQSALASNLSNKYELDRITCEKGLLDPPIDPAASFGLSAHFRYDNDVKHEMILLREPETGNMVGSLVYKISHDQIARLDGMKIYDPNLRRKGLGLSLMEKFFDLYPSVRSVVFNLTEENKEAIEEALLAQAFQGRRDCMEALKDTPAYKHLSKFGFSDWKLRCDENGMVYAFWGTKPR